MATPFSELGLTEQEKLALKTIEEGIDTKLEEMHAENGGRPVACYEIELPTGITPKQWNILMGRYSRANWWPETFLKEECVVTLRLNLWNPWPRP